jgi:hypothetical protein
MNAKARRGAAKRRTFSGVSRAAFEADGECRVSGTDPVWFRNGGCGRRVPVIAPAARQSKIYGETNRSDLLRNLGELSPMQPLAIYRGLLLENHCGIDRKGFEERRVARCFF